MTSPESEESEEDCVGEEECVGGSFSPVEEFSSGISSDDETEEEVRLYSKKVEKETSPVKSQGKKTEGFFNSERAA